MINSEFAYEAGLQAVGLFSQDKDYLWARKTVKDRLPINSPSAHNRSFYFKTYLEKQNIYSPTKHLEMFQKYQETVLGHIQNQWEVLERPKLFAQLKKRFSSIGLVTNENLLTQVHKLKSMDPSFKFFDFLVTSEEAGAEKPDLAIFKMVFEKTKSLPKDTWMVGDNYIHDIEPAHKLGLKTVKTIEFVDDGLNSINTDVIHNLDELLKI